MRRSSKVTLAAVSAMLVAACGGGSSAGAGGGAEGRFAGTFTGGYDASLTDRATGAVLVVDAGTVLVQVAADGDADVTFDGEFSVAGRVDGDDRLRITVDAALFVGNVGCNTGTVTLVLDFGTDGGTTVSGPLSSREVVCQGVAVALTGVVSARRL